MTITINPVQGQAQLGDQVATSAGSDPNLGDSLTYSLDDPSGFYAIDPVTGVVTLTQAGADHVNNGGNLPDVHVTVTDQGGLSGTDSTDITPPATVDLPIVSVEGPASVNEGTIATYTVKLNQVATQEVTVTVEIVHDNTTADDLITSSHSVIIPVGSQEASFDVEIVADQRTEGTESYTLVISNPQGATLGADHVETTINDTSQDPEVSIEGPWEIDEGSTATYTVRLDAQVTDDVTVKVRIVHVGTNTEDLHFTTQEVTIPAGSTEISFGVDILEDQRIEGVETYRVEIYDPINASLGTDSVETIIHDTSVNVPPLSDNGTATTLEDQTFSGTLPAATDPNQGDTVHYELASQPLNGHVVITDPTTGAYQFTPNPNFNGADSFTFRVVDNHGASTTYTINLTVEGVNDAPHGADKTFANVDAGTTVTITLADFGFSDIDDNDAHQLDNVIFQVPTAGQLLVNGVAITVETTVTRAEIEQGKVAFVVPAYNPAAQPSVAFQVVDNGGTANGGVDTDPTPNTLTFEVKAVNRPPVSDDGVASVNEDETLTGNLPSASDPDGHSVEYRVATEPLHGALIIHADGRYEYKPNPNYHGDDSFTFTVTDELGASNTYTMTITVNSVNDAPVAKDDDASTPSNTVLNGTLPAASDVDNDPVTYIKGSDPANGTVTVRPDGTYTYTPNPNYHGSDSFTYTVDDGQGGTNTYTIHITVENQAPTASNGGINLIENSIGTGTEIALSASDPENDSLTYSIENITVQQVGNGLEYSVVSSGTNQWTISSNHPININNTIPTGTLTLDPATGKLILRENSTATGVSVFDSLSKDAVLKLQVQFKVSDGILSSSVATHNIEITGINDVAEVGQTQHGAVVVNTLDPNRGTYRGNRSVYDLDYGERQLVTFDGQRAGIDVTSISGLYGTWTLTDNGSGTGIDWVYTADTSNIALKSLISTSEDKIRLSDHLNVMSQDRSAYLTIGEEQMPLAIIGSGGIGVSTVKLTSIGSDYNGTAGEDGLHVSGNVNANILMGDSDDAVFIRGDVGGYTIDMGEGDGYLFLNNVNGTSVEGGAGNDVVTVYGTVGNGTNIKLGDGTDTLLLFKDVLIDNTELGIQGIDRLDMRNGESNNITITGEALVANGTDLHIIAGDQGDKVELSGGFTDNGNGSYSYTSAAGQTYTIFDDMKIGFTIV